MSRATFTCGRCGAVVEPDASTWRCGCGGTFSMSALHVPPPRSLADVTLGEGNTPLVTIEAAGHSVVAKLELQSPTGSFKARGAAMLVAAALDVGATHLVVDSSGNAGVAIATYAGHAGLACEVFVPSTVSPATVERIESTGAIVWRVTGRREDVAQAAVERVESSGGFYASHVWNPWFLEGTKRYVYEIVRDMGRLPAALVLPVGNGTLVLGARRAFAELDLTAPVVAVQAQRCAPIANAFAAGRTHVEPVVDEGTIAAGIAIGAPVRGDEILAAVRDCGGSLVTVTDDEIVAAAAVLRTAGFDVEPTAAAPLAAWSRLAIDDAVIPVAAGRPLRPST